MKHFFTSTLVMQLTAIVAFATPVDLEQARDIAARQFNSSSGTIKKVKATKASEMKLAMRRNATTVGQTDSPLYYVFNRGGGDGGFVIVSGDDRVRSVLAYSAQNSFDSTTVNPGMKWWLDAVASSMERIIDGEVTVTANEEELQSSVEPLTKTKWSQGAPYNNLCPLDETHGGRCVTGCVATALAQVLNYHRYPATASGIVDYTETQHNVHLSEDLSEFEFDWDMMKPKYSSDAVGDSADAVAKLMYACGLSMWMGYCAEMSGTDYYRGNLIENFNIDKGCRLVFATQYSPSEWVELLRNELDSGRPILYTGIDIGKKGGHAFVCDGYDSTGFFHFNWGWGGRCDGYFDITLLYIDQAGYEFSYRQEALIGVQPECGGEDLPMGERFLIVDSNYEGDIPVTLTTDDSLCIKYDILPIDDFDGKLGVGFYRDGECTVLMDYEYCHIKASKEATTISLVLKLPEGLDDGTYKICLVSGTDETDYKPLQSYNVNNGFIPYILATVSGGNITLSYPGDGKVSLEIVDGNIGDYTTTVGEATVSFTVKNNGTDFNDLLCFINAETGDMIGYDNYVIEAGHTKTLSAVLSYVGDDSEIIVKVCHQNPYTQELDSIGELIIETPAGISDIHTDIYSPSICTVAGVCVGNDTSALPKGIYIRKGKKFIVK